MVLLSAWDRQSSRSRPLFNALKRIFTQVLSSNVFLNLQYIPSSCNPADFPSRRLSHMDASLSPVAWDKLQRLFGGNAGHSIDLMALPSNVQCDLSGQPLPFFSPYPTPGCAGVNVFAQTPASHSPSLFGNPYAFPPIALIAQLFHFLRSLSLPCTLIIPDVYPRRFWWPLLLATATRFCILAHKGDPVILRIPSSNGFSPQSFLPWDFGLLGFNFFPCSCWSQRFIRRIDFIRDLIFFCVVTFHSPMFHLII